MPSMTRPTMLDSGGGLFKSDTDSLFGHPDNAACTAISTELEQETLRNSED